MRQFIRLLVAAIIASGLLFGSTLIGAQESEPEKGKPAKEEAAKETDEKKVEAKAAAKLTVIAPAQPAGPADLAETLGEKDPEVLLWMQQLRPFVRAEYHIVVQVCEPTEEQRQKLVKTFPKAVRDSAKRWIERQSQATNGYRWNEPEAIVMPSVAGTIKPILSDEQFKLYQTDTEARKAQYQETAILGIVSILDQEVRFSTEQREQITAALTENWDEKWLPSLQLLDYGLRYFPAIPDRYIEPYLDETQKKIWQTVSRDTNIGFGLSSEMDNQALEDALRKADQVDPEPAAKPD